MEDLISRQTAINELMKKDKHLRSLNWNKYKTADYECVGVDECIDIIANLPSAQPEKAQLSEEGTTSDCISRQAAIDEIMKELKDRSLHDDGETSEDFADGYDEGIRNAATRVYLMSPAQPEERTEMHSCDPIERQDALDALEKIGWIETKADKEYAVQLFTDLPPAQPEQKKGKWVDNTYCSECGWVHETDPGFIGSVDGFNFCPRCGADMREDTNE